jgi:hypothetical protein
MHHTDDDSTDHLDDVELLTAEQLHRDHFAQLQRQEPHLRDTTYGVINGSTALVASWERWWTTNLAARMRGIIAR